jgi:release factor glutamine methyltransferase
VNAPTDLVQERLAWARQTLEQAGIPPPEAALDARLLAELATGWDRATLLIMERSSSPDALGEAFTTLVERRARREPLAYITGVREFWGLSFAVTPTVLVPRPETELIVESLLERFPDADQRMHVADVGTGSGCLAVAIAHERPNALVTAIDLAADAVEVARQNAHRHGVASRVAFRRGDLLEGVTDTFDAIVSNPPYVPQVDRETLQPEVRDHEPAIALFAGPDGLSVIARLVSQATSRLAPGGPLIFEIGVGQSERVTRLISETHGLRMVALKRDLQGIERVVAAERAS